MKKILSLLTICMLSISSFSVTTACSNKVNVNKKSLSNLKINSSLLYLPVYRFSNFQLLGEWTNYILEQNSIFNNSQYSIDYTVNYFLTKTDAQNNKNSITNFSSFFQLKENQIIFVKFIALSNSKILSNSSQIFSFKLQTIDNRLDLINFRTLYIVTPTVKVNVDSGQTVTIKMLKQAAVKCLLDVMYDGLYKNLIWKYDYTVNLFTDADRGSYLTPSEAANKPSNLAVEFYARNFSLNVINYSICDGFMPNFNYS